MAIREDTVSDISNKTKASRTTLYNWKNELISPELENKIKDDSSNEIYELKNDGIIIFEKVIKRLMKNQSLHVISVKNKKYISFLCKISPAVPNILNINFKADTPNENHLQI